MATAPATVAQLEANLKSTLHALSLIISFYSSVQSLSVTSYARQAPRQLTAQLQLEAAKYDAVCAQLEQRILRAIATLERDLLKATGQPIPADEPPPAPAPATTTGSELPFAFGDASTIAPKLEDGLPAAAPVPPVELDLNDLEMDDSFLNTSLFGDSAVQSPVAVDTTTSTSLATSAPPLAPTSLSLPFNTGSAAPAALPLPAASSEAPDFAALLAMVNGSLPPTSMPLASSAPLPASSMGLDLAAPFAGAVNPGGGDVDLDAMLSMLSGAGGSAGIPAPSSTAPAGLEGLGGLGGLDFGGLGAVGTGSATVDTGMDVDFGSFGEMNAGDLDELLKSLNGSS
ncbi:hypothetical protein BCR35DRAFT_300923 [Leucosporidium creatinivorum]|uniref:Uncharacterized protein n=1 Tax=Leucosporidium creatinivorum TaxID=106004 RepID=A0A1Y2FYH2_9BASI|nr:hypothetical protein BCR35DRAFT_300923 [Leucosporidium creatinivorum]